MKWLLGAFVLLLFVMIGAFLTLPETETPVEPAVVAKKPEEPTGRLHWKSEPKWSIPLKENEKPPSKSLAEAISDDDLCALLKNEEINNFEKLLQAFLSAISGSDEAEIIRVLSPNDQSQSTRGRFYSALRAGNLTYGPSKHHANLKEALEGLQKLEKSDPDNGVYALFAGPLLLESKSPTKFQIRNYQRAFAKPRVDSFIFEITQALKRTGQKSTSHFLASQLLLLGYSPPAWGPVQAHINRLMEKDKGNFSELVFAFSERGLRSIQGKAGNLDEDTFPLMEYQVMKSLYLESFKKLNPGSVVAHNKELMREPASIGQAINAVLVALEPMKKTSDCDRAPLDSIFSTWKQRP